MIPLTLLQVLVTRLIEDSVGDDRLREGVQIEGGDVVALIAATLAVVVLSAVTWSVLTGAITRAAAGTFVGRGIQLDESYRFGVARIGSIVLVVVLVSLAIVAGFLLLVIPGLIVFTRLSVAVQALVIEDLRGRAALRRSWDLVRGSGWRVFGIFVVAALLTGVASSVLTLPFGDSVVGVAVGQTVAAVLTTPYTALVGVIVYLDLRVRRERYGAQDLERDLRRTAVP